MIFFPLYSNFSRKIKNAKKHFKQHKTEKVPLLFFSHKRFRYIKLNMNNLEKVHYEVNAFKCWKKTR